ncbi:MAG: response regulator transcription factor [Chloroflexaceae bacterium]|nr:response regulator transcription factor [Chloroflexaceae bacterium]
MSVTSIVLVHEHTLFREGLRYNIANISDFVVVGEASNGQQAIKVIDETQPDMVLIDLNLPGVNGLEIARVIKRAHPQVALVLLAPSMQSDHIVRAIRAGFAAYLVSKISWDDLLTALREVAQGRYPINDLVLSRADVAAQVLDDFRIMSMVIETEQIYSPLSARELQVLELVAAGQTNKEIALVLDISNQTVKNHVSSILRKLAVNDRTQAVVYAIQQGWIQPIVPGNS